MLKRLLPGCAVLLACLLAACGSSSSSSSTTGGGSSASASSSSASSSPGGTVHIDLVTGDDHDPFYVTMNKGAQAAAAHYGATVTWQGPSVYGPQAQIQILDPLLAAKPAAPARRSR
jgi:ribose transport system substrate-binding protein